MSNKIDWKKTVNEYLKFNGLAREFCNTRNIAKGQLFYYKKKFLEAGTTFCPINIDTSETALITSIIKELTSIC